jgi:hypothetical protein
MPGLEPGIHDLAMKKEAVDARRGLSAGQA